MNLLIARLSSKPTVVGGAEQSAVLHARIMTELGHNTSLYSNFEGDRKYVKRIRTPRNKFLRWLWIWLYFPLFATLRRSDILNPHSREDQITLSLSKWLHHKPVVWKDAGDMVHNIKLNRDGLLGRMNQWLLVKAIKKADAIYMLNGRDKSITLDRLEKLGHPVPPGKISVVPSDILFADYNLKAKPAKQTHKLVIGTIIRLDEHKGVQYLLEAARNLNVKHKNLEYWIVGDGPYRSYLESLSDGLDNVYFFGHQDDISPYLAGMDIFVQPAEFEGWGRNVKEAMYFSLPVVGSEVGGIAEQIDNGQTGLLFEPKNTLQLEKQLEKLIKDGKLRTKLGQAAHKQAVTNGDYVELVRDKILPIFESVLAKN